MAWLLSVTYFHSFSGLIDTLGVAVPMSHHWPLGDAILGLSKSGLGVYRGQFQRPIGLGPGLVLENLTLECRETFTSAVTCPYHAWKRGDVLISTKNLMKKRGILGTSLISPSILKEAKVPLARF